MNNSLANTVNWRRNLVVVCLSQFMAMLGFNICMPFIPILLREHLHIDNDNLRGLYVSIYYLSGMISLCIATVVWGHLADRFGRKIMLLRASYGAAVFYPLLAFAGSFEILVLIRFVCSWFSGTINPAQTLIITTTPKEKHGFALGALTTSYWSGNMIGYLSGGLIVEYFGYTTAFVACGAIYLLSGVLVHWLVEENFVRPPVIERKTKAKRKWSDLSSPGVIYMMILMLMLGISRRIEQPFIAMQVEVVNGFERAAFYTGIVSATSAVAGIISGAIFGSLCDRFRPSILIGPVLLSCAAAVFVQALAPNLWVLAGARFAAFLAVGGIGPILQVLLSRITPEELRGTYFGWSASFSTAGGIVCSFISGALSFSYGVRGVVFVSALIFFLMFPVAMLCKKSCRKVADC